MADKQVIMRYSLMQESVMGNMSAFHEAVEASTAAPETDRATVDPIEQATLAAALSSAIGELEQADTGSTVMSTAQNGLASRLQAMLVEKAMETGQISTVRPAREVQAGAQTVTLAELLEVRFDSGDWLGWLGMAHFLLFKPDRSPWLAPPETPEQIPNDAVVAVFGDWGTGLYGSKPVAAQVQAMDRCDVVFHLGDTYYAGRPKEIANRLVSGWPTRSGRCLHRTLNGNHEMYSGGSGYFEALSMAPFRQSSSCVALQNDNWLLLGLDTSYTDNDIDQPQADWVTRMVDKAGSRKVLLFSHHQLYSKFGTAGQNLQSKLGPLLQEGRIYGWFFGHEHRLVLFDPHPKWGVRARCVGHGGFPEFRSEVDGSEPDETLLIQLAASATVPAALVLDGPNPFIDDSPRDPRKYLPHGYLVLEFDDGTVYETYKDPSGAIVRDKDAL